MGKGGLAFLNKKPWHTGSIKNMEIVWKAEQEEQKKQKRMKEHLKQIKEERTIEDLKRSQIQAGLITKSEGDRLEWMYQTPLIKPSEKEYLLGAPIKDEKRNTEMYKKDSSYVGGTFIKKDENILSSAIESESKLREDPMMEIAKKMRSTRNEILSNPVKMKKIYDEARILKELKRDKKLLKRMSLAAAKKKRKKGKSKRKEKTKRKDKTKRKEKSKGKDSGDKSKGEDKLTRKKRRRDSKDLKLLERKKGKEKN